MNKIKEATKHYVPASQLAVICQAQKAAIALGLNPYDSYPRLLEEVQAKVGGTDSVVLLQTARFARKKWEERRHRATH